MSTLVGVLASLRDRYVDMVNNENESVVTKIMTPVVALLAVVSIITAIIAYIWAWIVLTGVIFGFHAFAGLILIIVLIAKACGMR